MWSIRILPRVSARSSGVALARASPMLTGAGRRLGVMERVVADMKIEDCDLALALLQSLVDEPGLREVARLSIDDVLDRRNELLEASRMGVQS